MENALKKVIENLERILQLKDDELVQEVRREHITMLLNFLDEAEKSKDAKRKEAIERLRSEIKKAIEEFRSNVKE